MFTETFQQKLEAVQHNARLFITGLIRRMYPERFYDELGLDSQRDPRRSFKLFFFHKVAKRF